MQAIDIMTNNPVCCTPNTGLADAARLMVEADCGALPVVSTVSGRDVIGVITDRDIVCRSLALAKNPLQQVVQDCMTVPAITVYPNTPLGDCCDTMEANRIRRLIVVDHDGRCLGMISQADLAQRAPERLTAEVVREVSLSRLALRATF